MPRIVPAITTLLQHLHMLSKSPEVYRPSACPHCGLGGLWSHGCYERKADRGPHSTGTLNPIPSPRYLCRGCGRTCSRLPQCIAPRRWYGWAVQQLVLQLLLAGCSLHRCACWMGLDRRTAGRWRGVAGWPWRRVRLVPARPLPGVGPEGGFPQLLARLFDGDGLGRGDGLPGPRRGGCPMNA